MLTDTLTISLLGCEYVLKRENDHRWSTDGFYISDTANENPYYRYHAEFKMPPKPRWLSVGPYGDQEVTIVGNGYTLDNAVIAVASRIRELQDWAGLNAGLGRVVR